MLVQVVCTWRHPPAPVDAVELEAAPPVPVVAAPPLPVDEGPVLEAPPFPVESDPELRLPELGPLRSPPDPPDPPESTVSEPQAETTSMSGRRKKGLIESIFMIAPRSRHKRMVDVCQC